MDSTSPLYSSMSLQSFSSRKPQPSSSSSSQIVKEAARVLLDLHKKKMRSSLGSSESLSCTLDSRERSPRRWYRQSRKSTAQRSQRIPSSDELECLRWLDANYKGSSLHTFGSREKLTFQQLYEEWDTKNPNATAQRFGLKNTKRLSDFLRMIQKTVNKNCKSPFNVRALFPCKILRTPPLKREDEQIEFWPLLDASFPSLNNSNDTFMKKARPYWENYYHGKLLPKDLKDLYSLWNQHKGDYEKVAKKLHITSKQLQDSLHGLRTRENPFIAEIAQKLFPAQKRNC